MLYVGDDNIKDNFLKMKLGDIFSFEKKSKIKASNGKNYGMYKFFTSSNVQNKFLDEYIFDKESLIFGTGGLPSIHYCNEKFATSTDCFVIYEKNNIVLPKFVYYFFLSHMEILENGFKGAGLKHISKKYLQNIELSFPNDLNIQKQIVEKLENNEKLLNYRNESLNLSNRFLESLFINYFGDLRFNDKNWEISELKDVCNIVMGQSPPGDSYNYEGLGKEFFQGKAEFGEMYPTVGKWTTEPKRIAKKGSILFSVRAPVGSVNIANIECCIGRGLAAIESGDKLNNLYLFYYFKIIEDTIASRGTGSTFKSINKSQLSSLKVPVPPIELQNQFADIVQQVEEIKKHQLESKLELENLFNNLMQKAFRGE